VGALTGWGGGGREGYVCFASIGTADGAAVWVWGGSRVVGN